ncbi:MAG TPA: LysR substrate-binding domain-containing protein [Nocardioides sp.]|nr:LysR substrate-binding domain-containing protein [Nocardioides sp.]
MDLRQLRYFVTLAEELHFGRAAARLHMAQPPLSQAIRQLEADLGIELFRRTTRVVALTTAGEAFLARSRAILADVDEAADHARRVAAGAVGHLTIGCVGSATYSLLSALARSLTEQLPGVDVTFRGEMLVPDQVEALRTGTIDIALLRPPVTDASLEVRPLRRESLVVALPEDHRLAGRKRLRATDLAGEPLVVHGATHASTMYGVVLRLMRDAGIAPRIRHEVGETSTMLTLVAGGLGIAVVPAPVTALQLPHLTYVPLAGTGAQVELAVATRVGRSEPHLARAVEAITLLAR